MTAFELSLRPAGCICAGSASGPGLICQACRRRWAQQARTETVQAQVEQACPQWRTWHGSDRRCHALRREGAALQVEGEDWLGLLAGIRAAEARLEEGRPAAWRP